MITLAFIRHGLTHDVLASLFRVDRSTISRTIAEIRPLLAKRGIEVEDNQTLRTMADAFAYLDATGKVGRLDGSDIQVRRPKANFPGRRRFISGKRKQNTIKVSTICDEDGRLLFCGAWRPGRMHDQTAVFTEGIDNLLEMYPNVHLLVDAGYLGLAKRHPDQVSAPPLKPKKDARPEEIVAYEKARHAQSSARIPVEHGNAHLKIARSLTRWLGRREDLSITADAWVAILTFRQRRPDLAPSFTAVP